MRGAAAAVLAVPGRVDEPGLHRALAVRRREALRLPGGRGRRHRALRGVLGLLFSVAFLLPPNGTQVERIGLTDEVLCGLRDRVVPGNSALFVLTTGERPELAGADHELLVHRLTVDQGVALRRHFATDLEPS